MNKIMPKHKLLGVEWATLAYVLLTFLLMLLWADNIDGWQAMAWWRVGVVAYMVVAYGIYCRYPCKATFMLRAIPLLLALVQWYPDLYELCKQLPYQDHLFAQADQWLFGGQPSLCFSEACPSRLFSELMCLGYYSYYYIMAAMVLTYCFCAFDRADRAMFIFLSSFFLFYILFIFIPVAGPQYYFAAVDAGTTTFPSISFFAKDAPCLSLQAEGFFARLVVSAQQMGERPQAAFPSSHVGMTIVTLVLAWRLRRKTLFFILLPFALLLTFSTVYIKAHYLVDVLGAIVITPLIYWLSARIWRHLTCTGA